MSNPARAASCAFSIRMSVIRVQKDFSRFFFPHALHQCYRLPHGQKFPLALGHSDHHRQD
jgi:hypothetical protein